MFRRQLTDFHSSITAVECMTNSRRKSASPPESPKTRAQLLFQGQNNPKKQKHKKLPRMEQWIEVRIEEDGTVKTTLYPSNEQLIEDGQEMWPAPELVYRRINFPDGVPPEYYWATSDEQVRKFGCCGIQRMTIDIWLETIDREKLRTDGHVGPTDVPNLPRPDGTCTCPVCSGGDS
jgi:hypothetical protein